MRSRNCESRFKSRRSARVLLVGRDRKYLSEASDHLAAIGFRVATTSRPSEIADLVTGLDLNVAIVDGSHYLAATIRGLAAIEVIPAPLAVLTVAEDCLISPLSRPDVLPKWRSLTQLGEHIRLAVEQPPIGREPDVVLA